jgi:hypothetical protein
VFDNDPPADAAYHKAAREEILAFMSQSIAALPVARQKLIKQIFLRTLPCMWDEEEFMQYLLYTFNEIKTGAEKFVTVDSVVKTFERAGFEGWSGGGRDDVDFHEDDHEHGHHHHGHDHHHHHDGSCACGHEH